MDVKTCSGMADTGKETSIVPSLTKAQVYDGTTVRICKENFSVMRCSFLLFSISFLFELSLRAIPSSLLTHHLICVLLRCVAMLCFDFTSYCH